MTTIAWDGETIAADGRQSDGNIIASDSVQKIEMIGGIIYGYCGSVSDGEHLIDVVINGADLTKEDLSATLLTIEKGVVMIHCLSGGYLSSWESVTPYSIGSGECFALAAMDMGMSAKEAVKYAMKRDMYTGGKIKAIKYK